MPTRACLQLPAAKLTQPCFYKGPLKLSGLFISTAASAAICFPQKVERRRNPTQPAGRPQRKAWGGAQWNPGPWIEKLRARGVGDSLIPWQKLSLTLELPSHPIQQFVHEIIFLSLALKSAEVRVNE
jgi:hypothetical protein